MRKAAIVTAALVAAVFIFLLATLPPLPLPPAAGGPGEGDRVVPGAFHVHTTRSDGTADKAAVARAAARAGLRFVILSDHGDGTRQADPPEYIEGVLCLDGVEISTNGGHYVAVGMKSAPYPLGGEASAVVEDVARLGGFGVAAHPGSSRRELSWTDWSAPVDAVEWLNADSEWRDESRLRLGRTMLDYFIRPSAALASVLDRPAAAMARWDEAASRRQVVALAGHDAHGGLGSEAREGERRRQLGMPSYEASFRTFSIRAVLERSFSGAADADAATLLDALRSGRVFTSVDAIATGPRLDFVARTSAHVVEQGGVLPVSELPARFDVRVPPVPGARVVLYRNGSIVAQQEGAVLAADAGREGAYRTEVHVASAPGAPAVPWIVSNPIFIRDTPPAPPPARPEAKDVRPLAASPWHVEKDARSTAAVNADGGAIGFDYRLAAGERQSQFVALVTHLADLQPFDAVRFTGRADAPCRVSVQLRFAEDGEQRWIKSVYLDSSERDVVVRVADLVAADGSAQRPDVRRATSLLFVVDLTNARPGTGGRVTVVQPRLVALR